MVDQEELEDLREERRATLGNVSNYCPFGCRLEDLDENGYCEHLVGFTNQPRIGGKIENIVVDPVTEMKCVNGTHKRKETRTYRTPDGEKVTVTLPGPSAEVVQKGDELVNPEEEQLVNGAKQICRKWVSTRVYRKQAKASKAS